METDDFGKKVRDRRREEKLSQEELAQRVGISRNYLSQIERGQATNLSWQVMERLTSTLGSVELGYWSAGTSGIPKLPG